MASNNEAGDTQSNKRMMEFFVFVSDYQASLKE